MFDSKLYFDNQFAQLPGSFYTKLSAEKVSKNPSLVHFNQDVCEQIGLDSTLFSNTDFIEALSGNQPLLGAEPLAMVYSGHQFGVWAGQLGDGRALLLGQVRATDNQLWDIQLKGSGLTPYSRMGDGRAVMRSSIREYLCAEAMHALGIPTTRSLCLISTNSPVWREKQEPGALIARVAQTHIRFGHFEHFYYNQQWEELTQLADHVIRLYFSSENDVTPSYEEWFLDVVLRTARMIAGWMAVGFCHGVMNTDNMSITGLTIDYGPFGFLENFNPWHICNHSDDGGRYAYNKQPAVGLWNLQALAHALQPILSMEQTKPLLEHYATEFENHYHFLMCQKLGFDKPTSPINQLWNELLILLRQNQADYSLVFNQLPKALEDSPPWFELFNFSENKDKEKLHHWLIEFKKCHQLNDVDKVTKLEKLQKKLTQTNPSYVLRNWVAEAAIRAVEDKADSSPLNEVLQCLQNPYEPSKQSLHYDYAKPAPKEFQNLVLSCSS
jgi:uncharacterized protein YdiU (UPF0061 family)